MSNADSGRKALGRGLSALLPTNRAATGQTTTAAPAKAQGGPLAVPIDAIDANPLQPRTTFEPERLQELAQSIREHGIIQPLIVRMVEGRYQLIAGERRWRAARLAGLAHVPVIIHEYAADRLMEIALIENLQREDLNPIEVAQAFERLVQDHQLSHDQIAQRTGKDRSSVTNMLRLLRLPGHIQTLISEGRLTMGHARALLALPTPGEQLIVGVTIGKEGYSVRQVERLIAKMLEPKQPKAKVEEPAPDPNVKAAVLELERVLGTRVRIVEKSGQRGRVEIEYYSQEDLQRIYDTIIREE